MSLLLKTQLDLVHWTSKRAVSNTLNQTNVQHGFMGVRSGHEINPSELQNAKYLKQVHSTQVIDAAIARSHLETKHSYLEGDGVWTSEANITCGVYTADCLPILASSITQPWVAAIHAGWRGLTNGILSETLSVYPGKPSDLVVCIGPAISGREFEVGGEVVEAIYKPSFGISSQAAGLTVSKGLDDRWHVDLSLGAVLFLIEQGVPASQIEVIQQCTKNSPGIWHSYRREKVLRELNWSWIRLT